MSAIFIIMWKEIRDNLRDKRSLFFALLFGPFLMPALIMGPLVVNAGKHAEYNDSGRTLYVHGGDKAPNLLSYLKSKNLDAKEIESDFSNRIIEGEIQLVLEISDNYADKLLQGYPARITIHYQKEDRESQSFFWQVRGELDGYGRMLASSRMLIRGFDESLLRPIDIAENDLSEDAFGAGFIANLIMYLVFFSTMMGGFYLAVDTTAGERERLSLEPLLSLAITRTQVALGKYFAIFAFCLVSFILPIISVAIWLSFLPDSFFDSTSPPSLVTYLKLAIISFPVCFLMTGILMASASYAKSIKEAQTQMGIAMMIPMAPFFAVQFLDIKSDTVVNATPILSQYLLAGKIMEDSSYSLAAALPGAMTSFVLGGVFIAAAIHLFTQDRILGR